MKTILEFNLPEDREEFEAHYHGPSAISALCDMRNYFRKLSKYDARESFPIEEIQEEFRRILNEHEIGGLV